MIVSQTTMLAGGMLILLSLQSKTVEAATKYVFDISNSLEEVERSFMAVSGGKEDDYDSYEPAAMDPPDKTHDSPPLHNPTVLQQAMGLAPRHHPSVDVPGHTATSTINSNKNPDERNTAEHVKYTKERNRKRYAVSYMTLCHFKICNMGRKRTLRYIQMIRTLDNNIV